MEKKRSCLSSSESTGSGSRSHPSMASDLQNVNCLHNEGQEPTSMASVVADDILVNIFLKLPVKDILRCRSVCKSWCSLISSPIFITTHLNKIAAGESRTIITRRCGPGARKIRYTLFSGDKSSREIAEFDPPSPNPNEFRRILGSVNGLICLLDVHYSLMLWNPTIRKSLILDSPTVDVANPGLPHFGFGFDQLTDDYKIIRIVNGDSGYHADIFRLSSQSWSAIDLGAEALPLLYPRQAYLNGVVYWLAHDAAIVGFDLHTEKIVRHNLPDHLNLTDRMKDVEIAAWCGSLALFESENSRNIFLWLMNGVDKTWTRQCVIPFTLFPKRVKGIAGNGMLLVEDLMGLLFWFDPATREIDDLAIQSVGDVTMFHVKDYSESLVLLGLKNNSMTLDPVGRQGSTAKRNQLRIC